MVKGNIHSIESMGLVDGPGIRTVVFLKGCSLRCAYCHNPDTWDSKGGQMYEPHKLLEKLIRFKPYYERSNGGVTFSGGESLLQPEFLREMLKLCKENGIRTALDTAGYGLGDYEEILKYTDLVILDIKNEDDNSYKAITGKSKRGFDEFLKACEKMNTKLWIRHVVVPQITDSYEHMDKMAEIIKNIKNVEKVELLPYHTLGVSKYEKMGIDYRLKDVKAMDEGKCKELERYLKEKINSK
ncbi:MAG: pyruvate formate-lyase-activating protein [Clostridium sp.]|nr:pyruvate formate-lyase-activating protein [Clostridium sp.]